MYLPAGPAAEPRFIEKLIECLGCCFQRQFRNWLRIPSDLNPDAADMAELLNCAC